MTRQTDCGAECPGERWRVEEFIERSVQSVMEIHFADDW
jgi:hypothetical protein